MSSKDIKDECEATLQLSGAIGSGKIAHAYIFAGPCGSGRKAAAIKFAKALNCLAGDTALMPCDTCPQCRKIDASNHPDVSLIGPEKPGKEIGIGRIRDMTSAAYLKTYEGRRKVRIIDCDSGLSREAANAFLKTLEEPPADLVLILIVETAGSLLPTIVSRSQVIRFQAAGAPGLPEDKAPRRRADIIDALRKKSIYSLDLDGLSRQEARDCLDVMLTWYRDVMMAKAGIVRREAFLNPGEIKCALEESKTMEFTRLDEVMKKIIYTRSCLDQDANVKLAMATLAVELAK